MNFKPNQKVVFKQSGYYNPLCKKPKELEVITLIGKSPIYNNSWYVLGYELGKGGRPQSLHESHFCPIQYSSASSELASSFKETIETSDMPIVEPKKEKV